MKRPRGMKYIDCHWCKALEKRDDVAIEKYSMHISGEGTDMTIGPNWYFNFKGKIYQIIFCPYCGKKL